MRPFAAIAAVLAAACVLPVSAQADGMATMAARSATSASQGRPVVHRRVVRTRRVVHYRVRRWMPPPVALAPPVPIYFDWLIPSTLNPGYDRAMVLLFRSPAVSGVYTDDPGYPTTPVVAGVAPYQRDVCCAVFQYDGMAGAYVQLSQYDAAHALPPPLPGGVPIPLPAP